jgi:DNA-binding NarL/FixJ family response regulator
MNKMNVLLIDDHPLVNYGLTSCLEETGRFRVCGQAATLADACHFIEAPFSTDTFPSLIIVDIMLGADNGLDFIPFLDNFYRNKNTAKPRY